MQVTCTVSRAAALMPSHARNDSFDYSDCISNWAVPKTCASPAPPLRSSKSKRVVDRARVSSQKQHEQQLDAAPPALQWSRRSSPSGADSLVCSIALPLRQGCALLALPTLTPRRSCHPPRRIVLRYLFRRSRRRSGNWGGGRGRGGGAAEVPERACVPPGQRLCNVR